VASRAGRPAGGVPSTITRPERSTRFTLGWKKRCSSTSSVESAMPVASKTSALTGALEVSGRPAPTSPSSRSIALPSRPRGAAPLSTAPAMTGVPGSWRSSSAGWGRPIRPAIIRPGAELTTCV
jgi:hypothetical protein